MNNLKKILPYLLMLPAICIGIIAMMSYGVTFNIWIQNLIIWAIGTIVGSVYLFRSKNKKLRVNIPFTFILIALLISPFFFNGLEGVHRWLTFGPVNIYIASIILPILIIHICKLSINKRENLLIVLSFITLIILLMQPDAGQLTAFACVAAILLWKTINNRIFKIVSLIIILALGITTWVFLDDLAPVPYVEQILFLVADLGAIWFALGILSLLLLIIPFFLTCKENIVSFSLGVYFLMTMIVTIFGNFPMPIMGYGISPIIGYIISLTWLIKNNSK